MFKLSDQLGKIRESSVTKLVAYYILIAIAILIFRQIAQSLLTSKNIAIGSFGRRLRARKGPAKAVKAMARKLAVLYWRVMVKGVDYAELGIKKYEAQLLAQKQKSAQRLANELNLQLTEIQKDIQ